MTKKDYELVASAISISRMGAKKTAADLLEEAIFNTVTDKVVTHLCVRLKMENPAFDPEKFKAACR